MVQRYSHVNGTRWLDLWLIFRSKIWKKGVKISPNQTNIKGHQVQSTQDLSPLFYQTSKRINKSSIGLSQLTKLLITDVYKGESTTHIKQIDQEIQQMEKMLGKLQVINEVICSNETEKECLLDDMINIILNKLQTDIIERNIFVRIYAESDISFVTKYRLFFVMIENLIENAIFYSSPGSNQSYVEINLKKNSDNLMISIEDNGIGIRQEAFDKIFNIFYKDSEQSKGSGLGLYIVREALQKLDGKISLKSEEGCFTRIEVCIPAIKSQNNLIEKATPAAFESETQRV